MADATDNFDRAGGNSLGGDWIEKEDAANLDSFQIESDRVKILCSGNLTDKKKGFAYWNADPFAHNQTSQLTYKANEQFTPADVQLGPAVRIDPAGSQDSATLYMLAYALTSTRKLRLVKFAGQNMNTNGTLLDEISQSLVDGDILKIVASANQITGYLNDTPVLGPITDSDIPLGLPGIAGSYTGSEFGAAQWDDWEGGPISGEEELYVNTAALLEAVKEPYLRSISLLSYPEAYLKAHAVMEQPVDIFMRFVPKLQAETGRYLKSIPTLQREVFPFLKFEVAFPEAAQRYLKAASSMQARGDQYVRAFAQFVIHADYLKVRVALSRDPIFTDLGNTAPANKVGLLSRQYLSVGSVKKDVT